MQCFLFRILPRLYILCQDDFQAPLKVCMHELRDIKCLCLVCEDGKASDDDDDEREREEQDHSYMIRYKKETRILSKLK